VKQGISWAHTNESNDTGNIEFVKSPINAFQKTTTKPLRLISILQKNYIRRIPHEQSLFTKSAGIIICRSAKMFITHTIEHSSQPHGELTVLVYNLNEDRERWMEV